ncbi:MAG: ABC transporter permease subunit [Prevotella sp.]|nr:ABC transporter permease subunit [Prevotella sp.]
MAGKTAFAPSGSKLNAKNTNYSAPKTASEKVADVFYRIMRCAVVINVFALFFPTFNAVRVSQNINGNMSLFTCAISYKSMLSTFKAVLRRQDWLEPAFKSLSLCAALIIIAAVIAIVGGCLSLGNRKMKKLGCIFTLAAGAVELLGAFRINPILNGLINDSYAAGKFEDMRLMRPNAMYVYIVIGIIYAAAAVLNFFLVPKAEKGEGFDMDPKFRLFLMMLPVISLAFVFSYLPLYGWRYAFFDYKSGETLSMEKFVGFKWFTEIFKTAATKKDIMNVLKNTLAMSGLGILTSWVPMAFAIFLSEIKNNRFRRIVQTFTTIPNFISWVLVYALALAIFSTDGFINTMINSLNPNSPAVNTNYLMESGHMWLKMLAWGLWKGVGWSAIIYIAAISGIDQGLFEAATVDGAGRFARMWYITVPELIPTYCVLLLMSIANILSNGMDQYLVFSNAVNRESIQVLDLYVYNLGIGSGLIPLSTVVGMVKSIVSVILLFAANGVSKAIRGESIV